jgi:hypothetical protein
MGGRLVICGVLQYNVGCKEKWPYFVEETR